eukprot:6469746-Amphidinium_carterae.2
MGTVMGTVMNNDFNFWKGCADYMIEHRYQSKPDVRNRDNIQLVCQGIICIGIVCCKIQSQLQHP